MNQSNEHEDADGQMASLGARQRASGASALHILHCTDI